MPASAHLAPHLCCRVHMARPLCAIAHLSSDSGSEGVSSNPVLAGSSGDVQRPQPQSATWSCNACPLLDLRMQAAAPEKARKGRFSLDRRRPGSSSSMQRAGSSEGMQRAGSIGSVNGEAVPSELSPQNSRGLFKITSGVPSSIAMKRDAGACAGRLQHQRHTLSLPEILHYHPVRSFRAHHCVCWAAAARHPSSSEQVPSQAVSSALPSLAGTPEQSRAAQGWPRTASWPPGHEWHCPAMGATHDLSAVGVAGPKMPGPEEQQELNTSAAVNAGSLDLAPPVPKAPQRAPTATLAPAATSHAAEPAPGVPLSLV